MAPAWFFTYVVAVFTPFAVMRYAVPTAWAAWLALRLISLLKALRPVRIRCHVTPVAVKGVGGMSVM
jgi:hypothetical protein